MSTPNELPIPGVDLFIAEMPNYEHALAYFGSHLLENQLFQKNSIHIFTKGMKTRGVYASKRIFRLYAENEKIKAESRKNHSEYSSKDTIDLLIRIIENKISAVEALTDPDPVVRVFYEFWNAPCCLLKI
jgi:hypothetical protein